MKISLLFLFIITGFQAQTISKQVIGPTGVNFENITNKISYTLGELMIGGLTDEGGNYHLGSGYYPSLNLSTLSTDNVPELRVQIKVFPNPVSKAIFITHPIEEFFEVWITDVRGKQILKTIQQKERPINIQFLDAGIYFITVTSKESKLTNTYKIIKR